VCQALNPGWGAVRSLVQVNIANWQAQEAVSRRWKQPSKPPTWEDVIMMVRLRLCYVRVVLIRRQ
jgi:hypothetical protein